MKVHLNIFVGFLGAMLYSNVMSQTFTIDSMKIDEVNSQLFVYSSDLDFIHTTLFVTNIPLPGLQPTLNGFIYRLPDSGDGSAGNISIFSHGIIDTNWKITQWAQDINYLRTVKDSLYYTNKAGQNIASYPHIERVTYHFIFRSSSKNSVLQESMKMLHLNRFSYAVWNYNDLLDIPINIYEKYIGDGYLPVNMNDSTDYIFFGKDSIFFSYASLKNLACSYSYYYEARNKIVYTSGNATLSLDRQLIGLKWNDSMSIISGAVSFKESFWPSSPPDSNITVLISWSKLSDESPYVNPGNLAMSSAKVINSSLLANYPNPFSASTTIPFTIGKSSYISLEVVDLFGRKIATIAQGIYDAGSYNAKFNRDNLAAGTYFIRLLTENKSLYSRFSLQNRSLF